MSAGTPLPVGQTFLSATRLRAGEFVPPEQTRYLSSQTVPILLVCLFCLFFAPIASAQAPAASTGYVLPSAVSPGRTTRIAIEGAGSGAGSSLWTSFPCETTFVSAEGRRVVFDLTLPADAPPGIGVVRAFGVSTISRPLLVMIDDLPSVVESDGNGSPATAQKLTLPVAVAGVCQAVTSDYYSFAGRKDQVVSVDVVAARLGAATDPVVRLLDSAGREIAYCDDDASVGDDSRFTCRLPADGEYRIEIRDIHYEGGPQHRYRMRIGDLPLLKTPFPLAARRGTTGRFEFIDGASSELHIADVAVDANSGRSWWGVKSGSGVGFGFASILATDVPETVETGSNDSPEQASNVSFPGGVSGRFEDVNDHDCYRFTAAKGERVRVRAMSRSLSSPCDVSLKLLEPDGKTLAASKDDEAAEGVIEQAVPADGTYTIVARELNGRHGTDLVYRLAVDRVPGFTLSTEIDQIVASAGGEFSVAVKAVRGEFKDDIELALVCEDGTLELQNPVMKGDKSEATLKVKLSKELTPGRLMHFKVTGREKGNGEGPFAVADTRTALKKHFPRLLYPLPELDEVVAVLVTAPKKGEAEK